MKFSYTQFRCKCCTGIFSLFNSSIGAGYLVWNTCFRVSALINLLLSIHTRTEPIEVDSNHWNVLWTLRNVSEIEIRMCESNSAQWWNNIHSVCTWASLNTWTHKMMTFQFWHFFFFICFCWLLWINKIWTVIRLLFYVTKFNSSTRIFRLISANPVF